MTIYCVLVMFILYGVVIILTPRRITPPADASSKIATRSSGSCEVAHSFYISDAYSAISSFPDLQMMSSPSSHG